MSLYRLYVLNAQEGIVLALEAEFLTDGDALTRAANLQAGFHAAEVWNGDRLVARLGGEFSLSELWEVA